MAIIREQGILILFGFVITISLFLGDGKQPLVDVVWACEVLLLYAMYYLKNRKLRVLPWTLETAWAMLLGYCVVRAVFSDSVGYSISTVIRLFDAYLTYRLFYSLADKKRVWCVGLGVIIIGAVATIASFGCLLLPQFVSWLPQMNLLYASYGHNQLAGLLLFGIPLVITGDIPIPTWCKKTVFVLFLAGIIFSFARGAWVLLAAYFAFLLVTKRLVGKFNISMTIVFVAAAAGLLVTMFLLAPRFAREPPILNNDWLYKQTIKPPIYESRIQYWLQAARSIQERPIFGSGPGTFYLQSKRLQDSPSSYSWFAHSFILEQLVEVGLVGAVLWSILFVTQGRLLVNSRPPPLFMGVVLTFLYSLYEYNLNFLVIWLLFWSALGWLTGSAQLKKTLSPRPPFLVIGGIVLIFMFSLFSIGGMIKTAVNNIDAASLFTPFVADVVKTSLEKHTETKTPISQQRPSLIAFFHKDNPDVMYALARVSPADAALPMYERAIVYDPQNVQYVRGFIERLLEEKNTAVIGTLIERLGESVLPDKSKPTARQTPFTSPEMTALYTSSLFEDVGRPKTEAEYFSKTTYFLGLSFLNSDPALTRTLWILARDASPGWGYFHEELASLEYTIFHDPVAAEVTLKNCYLYPSAAGQCKAASLSAIEPPGYFNNYVKSIPALYP